MEAAKWGTEVWGCLLVVCFSQVKMGDVNRSAGWPDPASPGAFCYI